MVDGMVDVHLANFEASGAQLLMGSERFIGPKTIEVDVADGGTRVLRGEKLLLSVQALGPRLNPFQGFLRHVL